MASTSNTILTTTGTPVPRSFPALDYQSADAHMTAKHKASHAISQFRGAWNAISYRYREALDCAEDFQQHFNLHGGGPPSPHRYEQERMLFDFFGAGVSVLEAYFFAVFALASTAQPTDFLLNTAQDERKVKPGFVIAQLKKHRSGDPIISALEKLANDPRYRELHDNRNVLTHRAAPARKFYMGVISHRLCGA